MRSLPVKVSRSGRQKTAAEMSVGQQAGAFSVSDLGRLVWRTTVQRMC